MTYNLAGSTIEPNADQTEKIFKRTLTWQLKISKAIVSLLQPLQNPSHMKREGILKPPQQLQPGRVHNKPKNEKNMKAHPMDVTSWFGGG